MRVRFLVAAAVGLVAVASAGCGKRLPPIVSVEGTVILDGKPLPKAAVEFMPVLEDFGAETVSAAVTDEKGHFVLVCRLNDQPGAVTGQHIVLVKEPPLPEKMRGVQDGRVIDRYRAELGNRPIPSQYSSVSRTPLRIDVKADGEPITITLNR
jgi:hypothetical protein